MKARAPFYYTSLSLLIMTLSLSACNEDNATTTTLEVANSGQIISNQTTQQKSVSIAINESSNSLWHLDEITKDALKKISNPNTSRMVSRSRTHAFIAPPSTPVSRPNQLLNIPASDAQARFEVTDRTWPEQVGEMSIALWSQDKLAAFSLSIDDNHTGDHPFWFEMAEQYGWKWTWFLIANQIGWSSHDHWGQWQAALDKGHDIQSHSYSHLCDALFYTDREYRQSQAVINQNLTGAKVVTLAYPFGINTNKTGSPCAPLDNDRTRNKKEQAARSYLAARDVYGALKNPAKIDFMKVPSISASRNFFNPNAPWAYFDSVLDANSRNFRSWYSTHYHGIYGDQAKEEVRKILAHLKTKEDDVWVGSFTAVARYGQEFATASISNTQISSNQITFQLKDQMNDQWFDEPLTIKIRLPNQWQGSLSASQKEVVIASKVIQHNNQAYALIDAIPDQGEIQVNF